MQYKRKGIVWKFDVPKKSNRPSSRRVHNFIYSTPSGTLQQDPNYSEKSERGSVRHWGLGASDRRHRMLAVFDRTVAKSPEGLRNMESGPEEKGVGGVVSLADHFAATREGTVTIRLGSSGNMSYTAENQNPLLPRLFAAVDDIYCLFQGHIGNIAHLKQQYGLNKTANEVIIVIEAYRSLRDRGPYPADQVVRDFNGKFAFILYDCSAKSTFIAADADNGVPFYWGTDSGGHLVFSDAVDIIKKGCGKSFAQFPKGCFFTTSRGLQSFEHPLNDVKLMPRVDSQGEVCGATYEIDAQTKKESGMPRVGSAANWSSHY